MAWGRPGHKPLPEATVIGFTDAYIRHQASLGYMSDYCLQPDRLSPLHWRHNDHDGVSNHQPHGCLLNRLFRRRSKKTSKLRVTAFCVRNSPGPVNSPHKGPVTRKMFPFDDVIMRCVLLVFSKRPFSLSLSRQCRAQLPPLRLQCRQVS